MPFATFPQPLIHPIRQFRLPPHNHDTTRLAVSSSALPARHPLSAPPPPQGARPTGLPPEAVFSLGALTQLRSLSLHGAALSVDLVFCLSSLVGLTRLELGLVAEAWEQGGMRRRQQHTPRCGGGGGCRVWGRGGCEGAGVGVGAGGRWT